MEFRDVLYKKEAGVATLTLNRPDRMNAFSPEMSDGIRGALADTAADSSVRVLVITGSGRAFCAGADVKIMAEKTHQKEFEEGGEGLPPLHRAIPLMIQKLDKPVIGSINGVAVGGGLDLVLACDVRIASDKARFAEVFIRRGLVPGLGGMYFLPRLVGIDRACLMVWTGDMVDAREAERIGLVTMVVPHDELESATRDLAEKLAKGPPLAIQKAKRAMYDSLTMDLKTHIDYAGPLNVALRKTEDHKEGARAFVEKREPLFKGM